MKKNEWKVKKSKGKTKSCQMELEQEIASEMSNCFFEHCRSQRKCLKIAHLFMACQKLKYFFTFFISFILVLSVFVVPQQVPCCNTYTINVGKKLG